MAQEHSLTFNVALPMRASDDKVADVIAKARAHLKNLAGIGATNVQFRHSVVEKYARVGGPLGKDVLVKYVTVIIRWDGRLDRHVAAMRREYDSKNLERIVAESKGRIIH